MYTYVYVYICIYIYMYKAHLWKENGKMYLCIYACVYMYIYMYLHICIHVNVHTSNSLLFPQIQGLFVDKNYNSKTSFWSPLL